MKIAVIYARFSTDMQREESIEAQVRACRYYAQQYGYIISAVYADRGKSGTTTQHRTEFLRMMKDVCAGGIDAVLVHKLNRFSRKVLDVLEYKNQLADNGTELISVTEKLEDTPEGKLMLMIIAGMNEFYSDNLAGEVMKGLKENAYKCISTGGTPPLGFDIDPDTRKLVINDLEAPIVRQIFSMTLQGHGYDTIINTLNHQGFRTKAGNTFGKNSIYSILRNEKYMGDYVFNKTTRRNRSGKRNCHARKNNSEIIRVPGGCPAIVDAETFDAVQKIMDARRNCGGNNRTTTYLLSGKLFCGNCGARMVGDPRVVRRTTYYYYMCGRRQRRHDCDKASIPKELIEQAVLDLLTSKLFSEKFIEKTALKMYSSYRSLSSDLDAKAGYVETSIRDLDKKISNLVQAIATGIDVSEIRTELLKYKTERTNLQKTLDTIKNSTDERQSLQELTNFLRHFCDLKNLSPEAQKNTIQMFVDRIYVYDTPPGAEDFSRFRLEMYINPNRVPVLMRLATSDSLHRHQRCPQKTMQVNFLENGLLLIQFAFGIRG